MNEELMEIAFGIITFAGEAKFMTKEALKLAREGKFTEAREKLEEAKNTLNGAHKNQTALITKEANEEKIEMSVVLVHSQDHLMTTMSEISLAEELISMYELIYNK